MATLLTNSTRDPIGLLPAGQLWLPRASLTACLRGALVRSTLGAALTDAQRINHFPATPLCTLSWTFVGRIERLAPRDDSRPPDWVGARTSMSARWVLTGPQTQPTATWSAGPVHGMILMILPDALHALTGIEPDTLTNQCVDAEKVLPTDWLAMCEQVQTLTEMDVRLDAIEAFLERRWIACRPGLSRFGRRHADWAAHLMQRAAFSGPGRSLRQMERRIKRWSGLPMRELVGMGRAEQAFFDALLAAEHGKPDWSGTAIDAGYSDQSHLSRASRRITGFPPQALYEGIKSEESFWAYRLWQNL